MGVMRVIVILLRAFLLPGAALAAENLALSQQLAVLQVSAKRPTLRKRDRVFWVWLFRIWSGWRSCVMIVKPETVICWHREGFRLYWAGNRERNSAADRRSTLSSGSRENAPAKNCHAGPRKPS